MEQSHKRFTDNQVKDLIRRYIKQEIERKYIQSMLGISKSYFFRPVGEYRDDPEKFSIQYSRQAPTRRIAPEIEDNISREPAIDKKSIQNKNIPLWAYNYSYMKGQLLKKHGQEVSVPTIIDRAKKHGFYLKERVRKIHDRQVLTRYAGELIQHDSSHHLWAPDARVKWYLITSIDDFSRYILMRRLGRIF